MVASSIDQYLTGNPVMGEPHMTEIRMTPIDDDERAAIYRSIEQRDRAPMPHIDIERRRTTFDEVETGLSLAQAEREARRCMSCGCRKADCCRFRNLSTEYDVDVDRFAGERRRFSQDQSHEQIIYEPGKCIMCDACVRIAADAGEPLGVTTIGRGFDVTMGVPFDRPLSEGLQLVAKQCAIACPSGALALRTDRACDLEGCPLSDAALCDRTIASKENR
jgi:ferredoxin